MTTVQFVGMPPAGWKKPETERRLSDLVPVGVLTRVFPPELVGMSSSWRQSRPRRMGGALRVERHWLAPARALDGRLQAAAARAAAGAVGTEHPASGRQVRGPRRATEDRNAARIG